MLDLKFIRENPDKVKKAMQDRGKPADIDGLLTLDERRRKAVKEVEEIKRRKNIASDEIAKLLREKKDAKPKIVEMKAISEDEKKLDEEVRDLEQEIQSALYDIPNIPDPSVPDGDDERDAREERKWGEIPKFDFTPLDHITLMERLQLLELERGAKVSGFRGYFLKNEAVILSQAIWLFVLDKLKGKGYSPILAPALVKEDNLYGSGHFPQSREDVYKTQDDLYLSATAEIPMMGMHSDEIISESELPKKYVSFFPSL